MKVLHVIPSVDFAGGGPVEWVRQASQALDAGGHVSEVASLDSDSDECVGGFGAKVHALGPASGAYRYSRRFVPWLRENAGLYDCVISHGIWQYSSVGTWAALRETNIPYFVYVHGMLDPWARRAQPFKHVKKSLYWLPAEYRVFRDARAVLFTCEEERRIASLTFRPYRCREAVSPLGTTGPGVDHATLRRRFLARYPALAGKRLILFLGRIHPKKGCDLLIEAFAKVAERDPSLHLVIAGPDCAGWQDELNKRAAGLGLGRRVTWTGMLAGEEKWQALSAAELFALPSHQEAFPVSVIESLGCGLPVLITNKVNIWREIGEAGAGMVIEDDAASTVRALEEWLALSDMEREGVRQKARRCFAERYEAGRAVQLLLANLSSHGVGN